MKRAIIIIAILLLIINLYPVKKVDAAAAAVFSRVVKGSAGERVIAGMAEKAGIKYATKQAREKAVERWNLDMYNKIKYYEELGEEIKAQQLAEWQRQLANLDDTMLKLRPDKKGFGDYIVSAAMFATGVDILYEGYDAIKTAHETGELYDAMQGIEEAIENGSGFVNYSGYSLSTDISPHPSDPDLNLVDIKIVKGDFSYQFALLWVQQFGGAYFSNPRVVKAYNGKDALEISRHVSYINSNGEAAFMGGIVSFILPQPLQVSEFEIVKTPTIPSSVPNVQEVPVLDPFIETPYLDNPSLPEGFPEEITITVPEIPNYPEVVPEPWNPPFEITNPNPNPNPVPNPWPETVPNPGDGLDPSKLPGAEPIEEITPPEDTKPPSEDGCEKPWDFKNFKTLGATVSTKFPFSIPWDIYRAFYAVFGGMESSEGRWQFTLGAATDNPAVVDIKIPDFFDSWRNFVHTFLLIIFDIGLIYAIRKWLGGAS